MASVTVLSTTVTEAAVVIEHRPHRLRIAASGQKQAELHPLVLALLLFARMAASDAGNSGLAAVCAYFWVAWPVGGIACAITSLATKAAAGK